MLKKTSACIGLVVTTAAGALLASSPANAQVPTWGGGCCGSRHSSHHHTRHHNRNWNGNHIRPRIFIRIYIYNKNNNHARAVVLPPRERRRAEPMLRAAPRGVDQGLTGTGQAVRPAVRPADERPAAASRTPANTDQAPAATDQSATPTMPTSEGKSASSGVQRLGRGNLYGGQSAPREGESLLGGSLYGGDEEPSDATPTA